MMRALLFLIALALLAGCRSSAAPPPRETRGTTATRPRVVFGRTVRVHFEGNKNVPTPDLAAIMKIDKAGGDDDAPLRDVLARDILLVNALYYDRGYIQVEVGDARITESDEGPFVDVVIPIKKEGPRIKIGRLTIFERDENGKDVEPLGGKLRNRISLPDGAWFARDVIVRDLQAIRRMYRDAGYANVEAEPETDINSATASVDVTIPIRRGPLVYVEKIEVVGNEKIASETILRDFEPRVGALFHETKLDASKARLVKQNVFRSLDISTKAGADPSHLIIELEVVEK